MARSSGRPVARDPEASRGELVAFARSGRHGRPQRFTDKLAVTLAWDHFVPRDCLVRAKAHTIRVTAIQLLAIVAQRLVWQRRMGDLLLGVPRRGRVIQPREDEQRQSFPVDEPYLSFPGLGDRLAARIVGEIGDQPQQFETPNSLQCYAGTAPVTRRSGMSEFVVACRIAHNRYLDNVAQQWSFCSLKRPS
jgi:hypothetical protein